MIGRYEDRLPPWIQGHTRWIGIVLLAVTLGTMAYYLLSLLSVALHGSALSQWFGDLLGM